MILTSMTVSVEKALGMVLYFIVTPVLSSTHTHLAHMSVSRLNALPLKGVHEVRMYIRSYVTNTCTEAHTMSV